MAHSPNNLHNYIDEILLSLDEIRQKKEIVENEMSEDNHELSNLNIELESLTKRLESVNELIHRETNRKRELEKTIYETESTKSKISESFKTLLNVLKKESMHIE